MMLSTERSAGLTLSQLDRTFIVLVSTTVVARPKTHRRTTDDRQCASRKGLVYFVQRFRMFVQQYRALSLPVGGEVLFITGLLHNSAAVED